MAAARLLRALAVGLLLLNGSCAEEPSSGGGPTTVSFGTSAGFEVIKAAAPTGMVAELSIDGVPKGRMNIDPITGVPSLGVDPDPGTRTFVITYKVPDARVQGGFLLLGEATATTNIVAGVRNQPVDNFTLDYGQNGNLKFDNDADNSTNLAETRAETNPVDPTSVPLKATQVSTGGAHSCAVVTNGDIWCWGTNSNKQLGNNTIAIGAAGHSAIPVRVQGINQNARLVAAGGLRTCAVLLDNTAVCWGDSNGGLGDGSTTDSFLPVQVANVANVFALAAGDFHACAIVGGPGGSARCWGSNEAGQLGNGGILPTTSGRTPELVVTTSGAGSLTGLVSLSAGMFHSCATSSDGTAYCWGRNNEGQLGNGALGPPDTNTNPFPNPVPTQVSSTPRGEEISIMTGAFHTCTRVPSGRNEGSVRCWGKNSHGQLALQGGSIVDRILTPDFTTLSAATHLLLGTDFTCIRQTTGTVRCAGGNGAGQLGNGTFSPAAQANPTPSTIQNFVAQSLGMGDGEVGVGGGQRGHACALVSGGGVRCWGSNDKGQLGNDKAGTNSPDPVSVKKFE
jgi:alpha-tubulin suppressor-like RCC1 family protein